MDLLLIALLLAAVGAVVVVALGKVGGGLAPVQPDAVPALEGPVRRPGDLDRARFTLALRGYRMDQVDAVLDETRDLLAAKDDEIARLRGLLPAAGRPVGERPVGERPVVEQPVVEQPVVEQPVVEQPVERQRAESYESFEPGRPDPFQRADPRS